MANEWTCADLGTANFEGYASPTQKVNLTTVCTTKTPQGPVESTGVLPFTGIELSVFLVFALLLLLGGIALRTLGRRR